ncbi:hypothetical protein [Actinomadura craniellae]|uniref:hypothetical protein n=1 Tax=Actinomadura craniellae TaxID=2231787 RepID=UPI0011BFE41B|nr:hypothetical protein [Actinomadura craniellae]
MKLSTAPGRLGWFFWGFNLLTAIAVLIFALVANEALREGGDDLFATMLLLLAISFFIVIATYVLAAYRRYFWLEGTVAWRRGILSNQNYDLAVAEISVGSGRIGLAVPPIPRLVIRQDGRRPARLWLRNRDRGLAWLPAGELEALATAISYGRENDPQVITVVDALRRAATDPFLHRLS